MTLKNQKMGNSTEFRYGDIKTLKELQYQRRLLSSKIEHQETLISYKIRSIKEYVSPKRLFYNGFEFLAKRNSFASGLLRTYNLIRNIL